MYLHWRTEAINNIELLAAELVHADCLELGPDFRADRLVVVFAPLPVHQSVSRVASSMTMNLSFGERPVYSPVRTLTHLILSDSRGQTLKAFVKFMRIKQIITRVMDNFTGISDA